MTNATATAGRYDVLFEPVTIGPVTARNRFYQVPHCNGMGRNHPTAMAVMRGIKAEGGWAVVCTEQCDIHPTSETTREIRLWDDRDIPTLARMTGQVHAHGGLAGIELTHMGYHALNGTSREIQLAPSGTPGHGLMPAHAREMDLTDIADYRRWHRAAVRRAKEAGFDIIVVYAGHGLSLAMHFLSPFTNRRVDEYGGSLENRTRLLRELIEDSREEAGDDCGIAVRFAVDELRGGDGITWEREGRGVLDMIGELPDLWDLIVSEWEHDSQTSRFSEEGFQEPFIDFAKQHTSKPVVGVGRYTSPDHMVSLIKKGVLDMIGAARPSIADPFLPQK
ncbi:MAG: NADH:flavin oxidoreductase, partial [Alphaproteobacteria bacterium]|nr:NADH:flavin oxidoreductase [Alphaproteobacteria bacterium]